MTIQNLWDAAKAVLRGKFITILSYPKKQEKHHIAAKKTKTNKQKKNLSGKKEIIKIRAEINEKERKETIVKINETKSLFYEKIKFDKPIARLIKQKREKAKSTRLGMKKQQLQQTMQKYKGQ